MTISPTETRLASFGFTKANYERSYGRVSTDTSFEPKMVLLAVQKMIRENLTSTTSISSSSALSIDPSSGTFITTGGTLNREDLALIFERALTESSILPTTDRVMFNENLKAIADVKRIALYAPKIKLKVKDVDTEEAKEIEVSRKLADHSDFFKGVFSLATSSSGEGINVALPEQFSIDAFEVYLLAAADEALPSDLSAEECTLLLQLCEYLQDTDTAEKIIAKFNAGKSPLDNLQTVLKAMSEGSLYFPSEFTSKILNSLMNTAIAHATGPYGHGITVMLHSLSELENLELLDQVPMDLHIKGFVKNEDLQLLSTICPLVESLKISSLSVDKIPEAWETSLKRLDISEATGFRTIDRPLPQLEVFKAVRASSLTNIDGLNASLHLKEIDISLTNVSKAPTGCVALESFRASQSPLNDISGLNNLPCLREIDLCRTDVIAAPIGCTALESFKAYGARGLSDITGLSGLKHLKEISVSETRVEIAPNGCEALEIFDAFDAKNLMYIQGLKNLTRLKFVSISGTQVMAAPRGCRALEVFYGEAKSLIDITGLEDCPKLIYVTLPDHFPAAKRNSFTHIDRIMELRRADGEMRKHLFGELSPSIQNRLKWGFWLFSGMPEGDPEFGSHLFEARPLDPAVEEVLLYGCRSWNMLMEEEIQKIIFLKKVLEDRDSSVKQKLEAFADIFPPYKMVIFRAISVACGVDVSVAETLVKDNPDSTLFKNAVAKLVRAIG